MMDLKDAFNEVKIWLTQIDEDEEAQEDFYSFSQGYDFDDVANLIDTVAEWYERRINNG